MSFDVAADAYGRFMGRYSEPLAHQFLALVQPAAGQRALDVGCGPGALTAALAARLGQDAVAAVDPSEPFRAALARRLPGVAVRAATAEHLPFDDGGFDLTLAQLVVHFLPDPVAGIGEMARVTRPGGVVGACVWDHAGGLGPLGVFWRAALDVDPGVRDESGFPGPATGTSPSCSGRPACAAPRRSTLVVSAAYEDVDAWWQTFTLGVGPAGAHVASLDDEHRAALRARCAELLPHGPFRVEALAWTVTARV